MYKRVDSLIIIIDLLFTYKYLISNYYNKVVRRVRRAFMIVVNSGMKEVNKILMFGQKWRKCWLDEVI